jgi:putative tricarboxylic transport membrane protein
MMVGFEYALTVRSIFYIFIGTLWGIIGGAIPGINGAISIALLLPFTYGMVPFHALSMLAAVYVGVEYGGSIPAVLIATPGTGAAAATVIDGYQLKKQGRACEALLTSLWAGTIGGLISAFMLIVLAVPLADFGLLFGPAEYFLLALFGLSIVGSLSANNQVKGLASACFGLLLATVGTDPFSGENRFTFGYWQLSGGITSIPVMIGLFALGEIFYQIYKKELAQEVTDKIETIKMLSMAQIKKIIAPSLTFGVLGNLLGVMPGAGATIASWLGYSEARRWSKHPETFGKGEIMGVIAPESANNGVPAGALVPLLALGIPGSNSAAILLGAFMIHGVAPGPLLFVNTPEIPYTIMACMILAQLVMLFLGHVLIGMSVRITSISKVYMSCVIIALTFVGAYAEQSLALDVVYAFIFGLIGFFIKISGFSTSSMVLGFILGELFERNFRRALTVSNGSLSIFAQSTTSKVLLLLVIIGFALPVITSYLKNKRRPENAAA